ncbi:MAG: single-stranded DNA-binding protein [Rikenellaceae bacterium]|nr:single-stranded DNA-binding protein [Rikenellaceae bacterium]
MINKVILIGNVGADPEVRTLESGVKVARVRLATTERIYNRQTQEARDHTEWHTITLWRNLADTADRFVKKGSQIYVEGKIRSNEWTDQSGAKRYGIEIMADDMKLLGRRSDSQGGPTAGNYGQERQPSGGYAGGGAPAGASAAQEPVLPSPADDIDDLPF